mmetsp:Transcript_513/g.1330  ORF Transcript_513/g.1330 Transcript_513/m.1330 type:complete len:201 (+) Transcript_513:251-853(+)
MAMRRTASLNRMPRKRSLGLRSICVSPPTTYAWITTRTSTLSTTGQCAARWLAQRCVRSRLTWSRFRSRALRRLRISRPTWVMSGVSSSCRVIRPRGRPRPRVVRLMGRREMATGSCGGARASIWWTRTPCGCLQRPIGHGWAPSLHSAAPTTSARASCAPSWTRTAVSASACSPATLTTRAMTILPRAAPTHAGSRRRS